MNEKKKNLFLNKKKLTAKKYNKKDTQHDYMCVQYSDELKSWMR